MTTNINQKEYLKKYLGIGKTPGQKKKKKNKEKNVGSRLKIIDDDVDVLISQELEDDIAAANEYAPQIVAVIDERPPSLQIDEKTNRNLWSPIGGPSKAENDNQHLKLNSFKLGKQIQHNDIHKSLKLTKESVTDGYNKHKIYDKKNYSTVKIKPENYGDSNQGKSDRQRSNSPFRKDEKDLNSSPPRKYTKNDSSFRKSDREDVSPIRRKHDEKTSSRKTLLEDSPNCYSDYSPPRRKNKEDSSSPKVIKNDTFSNRYIDDSSPPRRKNRGDSSPPRRKKEDSSSPRRRNREIEILSSGQKSREDDYSPPRRNVEDDNSPVRRRNRDIHTPPKRKYREDDNSPLRKRNNENNSPPRRKTDEYSRDKRTKEYDYSPQRKKYKDHKRRREFSPRDGSKSDLSPTVTRIKSEDKDISPSRKRNGKKSRWSREHTPESALGEKMKKTLDGKRAGLQSAKDLSQESKILSQKEDEVFKTMSAEVSGRNAATIVRGKKVRDLEEEAAKSKREAEMKEKYDRWGKGLKQVEDQNKKIEEQLHEMSKPLARYADDEDLEKFLKEQEREGDPMLSYIRKKKKKDKVAAGIPEKPMYMGEFMPNRFGIPPGYRWDGVDRSNGYEKKWFQVQNEKKASREEAFKWSTEDM